MNFLFWLHVLNNTYDTSQKRYWLSMMLLSNFWKYFSIALTDGESTSTIWELWGEPFAPVQHQWLHPLWMYKTMRDYDHLSQMQLQNACHAWLVTQYLLRWVLGTLPLWSRSNISLPVQQYCRWLWVLQLIPVFGLLSSHTMWGFTMILSLLRESKNKKTVVVWPPIDSSFRLREPKNWELYLSDCL